MSSRKLSDLTPYMEQKAKEFIIVCTSKGLTVVITCTARDINEQKALYAQGREPLPSVNAKRKAIGLPDISAEENSRKVTWTLNSEHVVDLSKGEKARAFDFALAKDGKVYYDLKANVNANEYPDYYEAGQIGKSLGLIWGGDWKTPDMPHFQEPKKGDKCNV